MSPHYRGDAAGHPIRDLNGYQGPFGGKAVSFSVRSRQLLTGSEDDADSLSIRE